jgi:plasmid maintenance system antidote protein VapI
LAPRIVKAFGVSMDRVMRMQNSGDIAQTPKRNGEIKVAPFKVKSVHTKPSLA